MAEPVPKPARWPPLALATLVAAWIAVMAVRSQVPPAIECDLTLRPDADTVVMLSASWCQYCRAARRFLHREHIKYCEYDIETSTEGRRRYRAQTTYVIPILSLRDQVFIGFDESQITQALIGYGLRGRQ